MKKRLRIFAGPNGSGKSTLIGVIPTEWLGYYINPDEIEKQLNNSNGCFDFSKIINFNKDSFLEFIQSAFYKIDLVDIDFDRNKIYFKNINSYVASILSSFIREELLKEGRSFTFETVMSSKDKIEFLKKAQQLGFRVYLYFIATDDIEINISRVENRVKDGGHDVPKEKIISRYYRTLDNLIDAIKYSDRAFLFDNSGENKAFICEIEEAKNVTIKVDKVPSWFNESFLDKVIDS
jgi:predicted ABC-type ATPase